MVLFGAVPVKHIEAQAPQLTAPLKAVAPHLVGQHGVGSLQKQGEVVVQQIALPAKLQADTPRQREQGQERPARGVRVEAPGKSLVCLKNVHRIPTFHKGSGISLIVKSACKGGGLKPRNPCTRKVLYLCRRDKSGILFLSWCRFYGCAGWTTHLSAGLVCSQHTSLP